MSSKVRRGKVIFRQWDHATGLQETAMPFFSLDELFELCLRTGAPLLVDRVIIEGEDAAGAAHLLSLVFQSVMVTDGE